MRSFLLLRGGCRHMQYRHMQQRHESQPRATPPHMLPATTPGREYASTALSRRDWQMGPQAEVLVLPAS